MHEKEMAKHFDTIPTWSFIKESAPKLQKQFKFADFNKAMTFVSKVAEMAEDENYELDIIIRGGTVK